MDPTHAASSPETRLCSPEYVSELQGRIWLLEHLQRYGMAVEVLEMESYVDNEVSVKDPRMKQEEPEKS